MTEPRPIYTADLPPWTLNQFLAELRRAGWTRMKGSVSRTYISPDDPAVTFQADRYELGRGVLWRHYADRRALPPTTKTDGVEIETPTRRLSRLQSAMLRYIVGYKAAHDGNSPTARQIMRGVGITSLSVVSYNLRVLEECGHVRRPFGKAAAIEVAGGRWVYEPQSQSEEP